MSTQRESVAGVRLASDCRSDADGQVAGDAGLLGGSPTLATDGSCNLPDQTPQGTPSFSIVSPSATSITFRWRAPAPCGSAPITHYIISLTDEDGRVVAERSFTGHASAATPFTETVDDLTEGTTDQVRLRARSLLGCYSAFGDVETVTTTSAG